MGYSHYWTPKKVTQEQWDEFVDIAQKMLDKVTTSSINDGNDNIMEQVVIRGGMGDDEAIINNSMPGSNGEPVVWFNGNEDTGEDHETFCIIKNELDWEFCKTARKPYDVLVVGMLCAAKDILKFETSTDGDLEDWLFGIKLYTDMMYGEIDKDILMSCMPEQFYKRDFEFYLLSGDEQKKDSD